MMNGTIQIDKLMLFLVNSKFIAYKMNGQIQKLTEKVMIQQKSWFQP